MLGGQRCVTKQFIQFWLILVRRRRLITVTTTIAEYLDVRARARELQLPPVGELSILPRGFATVANQYELLHENDASTLRKLLAQAGLAVQTLEPPTRLPTTAEKSADWIAPTIFVGSMLLTQNQYGVQIALDVITSYIVDFLKGRLPTGKVRLSFIVETTKSKTFKHLTYDGP